MSKLITLVTILSAITLGACLSGDDDDLITDETLASSTNPHPEEVSCLDRFETTYSEWICVKPNGWLGEMDCVTHCTYDRALVVTTPYGALECRVVDTTCENVCEPCGNPD